jgi:hypothetical protein
MLVFISFLFFCVCVYVNLLCSVFSASPSLKAGENFFVVAAAAAAAAAARGQNGFFVLWRI